MRTPEHPHAQAFLDLMAETQAAYERRDLETYLGSFSADYSSVVLDSEWWEDRARLEEKMTRDLARFDLVSMDFSIKKHWYSGETGFAHLAYLTRLRYRDTGRLLVDERENVIVGHHEGDGRWILTGKIVLRVNNFFEEDASPEI